MQSGALFGAKESLARGVHNLKSDTGDDSGKARETEPKTNQQEQEFPFSYRTRFSWGQQLRGCAKGVFKLHICLFIPLVLAIQLERSLLLT